MGSHKLMRGRHIIAPSLDSSLLTSSSSNNCIIRRICTLLNPDVPPAIRTQVYAPCLRALRDYITGPGIAPLSSTEESVWSAGNGFAKQIVELENLPLRLLKIFDLCLTATVGASQGAQGTATAEFQLVLSECLKCLVVYVEDHLGCLEGMLHNGLRDKVIHLLQSETSSSLYAPTTATANSEILKQSLHLLCVLCGYSHSFEGIGEQGAVTSVSAIPVIVGINEQTLYEILLVVQKVLSRDLSSGELIVINVAILCQYLLPLCSSSDPMYQVTRTAFSCSSFPLLDDLMDGVCRGSWASSSRSINTAGLSSNQSVKQSTSL
jgi:hypothetical protein